MRITDLLKKESILLGGSPKSKNEAIDMLVELQVKGGNIADKEEYKKGIMGLSFITEGAIPYAAADPGRVIPACMIGAGTAGALSMAFGCTLRAPHGGIFVFPVVGNPIMYVVALVISSVVGMLLLGLFKKKVTK